MPSRPLEWLAISAHLKLCLHAAQADPPAVADALAGPRLLDAIREHYGTPGAPALPEAGRPAAGGGLAAADVRALRQVKKA